MWTGIAAALIGAIAEFAPQIQSQLPSGSKMAIGFGILMMVLRAITEKPLSAKGDRRK
jgi:hypothetical protein